jgi:parallel beta-helix repeat protein
MPAINYVDPNLTTTTAPDVSAVIAWASGTTYAINALAHDNVAAPNRKYYKSLQNTNLNHALTDTDWWVCVVSGTYLLPYRGDAANFTLADTGNTDTRVIESPADTTLSGTLAWVNNSATIATSADLTGVLAAKDLICKSGCSAPGNADGVWAVLSITSTTITLTQPYMGTTATVSGNLKVGVSDIGTIAAATTAFWTAATSGAAGALHNISGGWSATTGELAGKTVCKQSGADWYGFGLTLTSRAYVSLANLGFARCNIGIRLNSSTNNTLTNCTGQSGTGHGFRFVSGIKNVLLNCTATAPTPVSNVAFPVGSPNQQFAQVRFHNYNVGAGDHRAYAGYGTMVRNTANARGGVGDCLAITPSSATIPVATGPLPWGIGYPGNVAGMTLSVWLQASATFNGALTLEAWCNGVRIVAPVAQSLTTAYAVYSLTVGAAVVAATDTVELRISVTGTVGSVYVDDAFAVGA